MAQESAVTLQIRRSYAAPREKVFRAWTETKHLRKWFAPSDEYTPQELELDLRVGGRYRFSILALGGVVHTVSGTYREIKAPEKLVYTWAWEGEPEMGDTLVTVEFHEMSGQTEVVLTHERFPNEKARDEHNKGWSALMNRLAKQMEQGSI